MYAIVVKGCLLSMQTLGCGLIAFKMFMGCEEVDRDIGAFADIWGYVGFRVHVLK